MAILPSRPGIKISIVGCNGAVFQEYDDDEEKSQPNAVDKYVEAVSGVEFGIRWELTSPWPPYTILFQFEVDQKWVGGTYCKPENFKHPAYTGTHVGATAIVNGQGFLHKFAFAALDIGKYTNDPGEIQSAESVGDSSAPIQGQLMKNVKDTGQITAKAYFVKSLRTLGVVDRALDNCIKDLGKIPEKALKGRTLSHQTS